MDNQTIQILFGTESGNAERMAIVCHSLAKVLGLESQLIDMAKFEPSQLKDWSTVIISISTNGEGEMPFNAEAAWDEAKEKQIEGLEQLKYGILSLGDTSYDYFCQSGIDWDNYLKAGGAKTLIPRIDLDVDFYEPGLEWIVSWFAKFTSKDKNDIESALEQALNDAGDTLKPNEDLYSQQKPWNATIQVKRNLCSEASSKTVCHYELDLTDSGIEYKPGDCLEVQAINDESLVDQLIEVMAWQADTEVNIGKRTMPLRQALINHLEIRDPSIKLLEMISGASHDLSMRKRVSDMDKGALEEFLYGHDVLSLVTEYSRQPLEKTDLKSRLMGLFGKPQVYPRFDANIFVNYLKSLQPRAYSIASSQAAHPNSVHLTSAEVEYNKNARQHKGLCSNFLASQAHANKPAACWLLPNKYFAVPEDNDTALIMIGPGTGIAPFIGFLQERQARKASGKNWLLFGDRTAANDFLYKDELNAFKAEGTLSKLDTAFSRDQEEKVYVQHKIIEAAADFFQWLEEGAVIYVCGDAKHMAEDVDKAIHSVIETAGNMTSEQAHSYVKQLQRNQRYLKDVY